MSKVVIKDSDNAVLFGRDTSERYVIALCLQSVNNYIEVAAKLGSNDFLFEQNRILFDIIGVLIKGGITKIDFATVTGHLNELGLIERVGGYDYIRSLFNINADLVNLNMHVDRVLHGSVLSKLYDVLEENRRVVRTFAKQDSDSTDVLAKVESSLMEVAQHTMKTEDGKLIHDGLYDWLEELKTRDSDLLGIPSGFTILDGILCGFSPKRLYVVAARPKVGKSTLLSTWALNVCKQALSSGSNASVLYIDTEMSFEEFRSRALASLSGVPEKEIKLGRFYSNKAYVEQVEKAAKVLEKMHIVHKYMPGFNIDDVASTVKKYKARDDISAFFFDYIKMVELNEHFNETQTLGHITSVLKDLAGILEIPVITAVQLNRNAANRSKINSQDIADSDRVLRYCDVLMALAPKTADEISKYPNSGTHRLQILENRSGPPLDEGIDLEIVKPITTISEAPVQSPPALDEQSSVGVTIG